jgi:hypothetical protein
MIFHNKPPLDVLFEYRKQFPGSSYLEGISCASIVAIERLRFRGQATGNQSESAAFRDAVEIRVPVVCQT